MNKISDNMLLALAVSVSVWVVLANGYLYFTSPQHASSYLLAIAVVCLAWAARQLEAPQPARRTLTQAIVLAGLLVGIASIAQLGWAAGFAERGGGVMQGVIVAAYANVIPKQASSARGLARLRLAGWALVLGGVGYALAWLVLPLPYANIAALLILLLALGYATVRIAWSRRTHRDV